MKICVVGYGYVGKAMVAAFEQGENIDYDIVVKGLESKFGPKTDENEREFRSFFDKIIQVPFSMPTGTYDIENFL